MNKKYLLISLALIWSGMSLFSQVLSPEELKRGRWLSQEEYENRGEIGKFFSPTEAPEGPVNPVAEFEPMQGALIAYPFGIPMNLIAEMSEVVVVITIVSSEGQATSVSNLYSSNGVNMDHVEFLIAPHDTYWTRDYGPWFIREEDQVSIINFTYNRPRPDDNIMPVNIANLYGVNYYNMPVIHTGGNYMCDGFGIAAQTELVYEENSISDDQVDQYMEEYMGVTDNYVITDPLGDYIKHIDCWAKFLDVDKVLVAEVPESDPRYEDYEAAANYFASRNCAYGYPFEVIRVWAPGDYPYTPYTNALILNNKVFLPITGSTHDAAAIATWEAAMPGYEIVPILDGNQDWINSDALHCRVHEIADFGMLKITHIPPFHGEVNYQSTYTIEAKIHAYSNENLYADSLLLIYQVNGGDFEEVVMTDMGEEIFSADIMANPGEEVAYYIHAADESGRSENLPYIGAADPFTFNVSAAFEQLTLIPDTVYLGGGPDPRMVIKNTGEQDVEITNIFESVQDSPIPIWWIEYMNPDVSEFPYTLAVNDSIEVFFDHIIFRDIYYDSLKVTTSENLYFGIVANDITATENLDQAKPSLIIAPNPLSSNGSIQLSIEESAAVILEIYQVNGQLIERLENSRLSAGTYQYQWDGSNSEGSRMENGVYLVRLQKDDQVSIQKWIKM